jgi:hypothetical protein
MDVLAVLLGFLVAVMDVLAVTLDILLEKRTYDMRIIALGYKPLMVHSTVYNIRKITIIRKPLFALQLITAYQRKT